MGPQSGSCGYSPTPKRSKPIIPLQWVHSLVAVVMAVHRVDIRRVCDASMGPQSGSCGYIPPWKTNVLPVVASMGPQSGSCGYGALRTKLKNCLRHASMGPQSGSCGYVAAGVSVQRVVAASMGPQSGSCGYSLLRDGVAVARIASMGPQSGSCGYHAPISLAGPGWRRLQWVHSLVAVVIHQQAKSRPRRSSLQWVHSLVAVVIADI